jgi:hypothetical protein
MMVEHGKECPTAAQFVIGPTMMPLTRTDQQASTHITGSQQNDALDLVPALVAPHGAVRRSTAEARGNPKRCFGFA